MKNAPALFVSLLILFAAALAMPVTAQQKEARISFTVSMPDPASRKFEVEMRCEGITRNEVALKMPAWMPGYYQLLHYADYVRDFNVRDGAAKPLPFKKTNRNTWTVQTGAAKTFVVSYKVETERSFVATSFLDASRGYIAPAGLFLHPEGFINNPVTVTINPYKDWTDIATGLEKEKNTANRFTASDFDILYDCPILIGKLDSFPSFKVQGIPHYFYAYKPDAFDRQVFMNDLQKIVTTASDLIGDIPYSHYTFIGIGPGGGGIEHLNSATVAFTGIDLANQRSKARIYHFLAHEYFHHYNVKRIRPIELGPFDYDNGSRTKMLWLSEGLSVYYEYMVVKRAGLTSDDEILETLRSSIKAYESKPGRQFQTPAEASYQTWEDGPFGRTGDEVNKTISPYDKGPALGMLLDFKLRHETKNKRSLDDLMRLLYNKYYREKKRGFTEAEFRSEAEAIAGTDLSDFFDYIYTLKPVDYPGYFKYAGLKIDTVKKSLPGAWLGAGLRDRNDTLWVTSVDWQSPAWEAGLRNRRAVLGVNGQKMNAKGFTDLLSGMKPGDTVKLLFTTGDGQKEQQVVLGTKMEADYAITRLPEPDPLQRQILESWLRTGKN